MDLNISAVTQPCINGVKAAGSMSYDAILFIGRPFVWIKDGACSLMSGTVATVSSLWAKCQPMLATGFKTCVNPTTAALGLTGGACYLAYKGYKSEAGQPKMTMMAGAVACAAVACFTVVKGGAMPF